LTAADIEFFLDLPRRTVNSKLKRLLKAGLIAKDGDRYRCIALRPKMPDELRRIDETSRRW
jgi:Fic family protein